MKNLWLAAAAVLALPAPAAAAVVLVATYTGVVDAITRYDDRFGAITVGDSWTAVFRYDSTLSPGGFSLEPGRPWNSIHQGYLGDNPVSGTISFNGGAPLNAGDYYGISSRQNGQGAGGFDGAYYQARNRTDGVGNVVYTDFFFDMSIRSSVNDFVPSLDHTVPVTYNLANGTGFSSGSLVVQSLIFFNGNSGTSRHVDISLRPITLSMMSVAVPEPEIWALMIIGFGAIGSCMRRRKAATASVMHALT